MALIDLTGQRFGRLLVLYRDLEAEKKAIDRHAKWKCQCDCGNLTTVEGRRLRKGTTQSCGCLQRERTSITHQSQFLGKRFGKLLVIQQLPCKNHRTYWRCQCDCGNIVDVCGRELSKGDTQSCGCIHSLGENRIETLLKANHISYQKEFQFKDLYDKEKYSYLRFDFGIFSQGKLICLIEYDGYQHYKTGGWNTEQQLQLTQAHDTLKTNYCNQHHIPLIRIPYWDYDKLTSEYLLERIQSVCQLIVDT